MIPLFLIWVYLLWVLILFGAELVRSLETFRVQDAAAELPDLLVLTVILWQCWRRQQKGLSLFACDGFVERHRSLIANSGGVCAIYCSSGIFLRKQPGGAM